MTRTTRIQTDYQDDVDIALQRFGDHEDMSEARVVRWLAQFPDEDLTLALQIIQSVRYVNGLNLRSMTAQLLKIAVDELKKRGHKRLGFVAVGNPGSGSSVVARVLRDLVRGQHRMLSMVDLISLKPGQIEALVFVDDFSGTGNTLQKWWQNVESLVRPTGSAVYVGLLLLNERARDLIEKFAHVLAVDELLGSADVFSNENRGFSVSEKATLLEHCRRTGCGPEYERGRGQCGLLLSFKHGCPNNSLPVLWFSGKPAKKWRPLFNRRAI